LKTPDADVARHLAFLYAEFPLIESDAVVDAELTVRRKLPWLGWFSIRVDGAVQYNWLRKKLLTPMIEWTFNVCVFQRPHQYFMLHAGVVAKDDRALILPGRAGSGKSTLCAALLQNGWRLLSDEVALVRPEDGRLQPVPRPVSLKEDSIRVIGRLDPNAVLGPEWHETPKGTVAHLLPPSESVARADETAEPAWLLFPKFDKDVTPNLEPVKKATALMRAADNAFNYSVLGKHGFEMLTGLIDRCRCYEIRYGSAADTLEIIESLTSSPAAGTARER
jgi:HprK-related kinase A